MSSVSLSGQGRSSMDEYAAAYIKELRKRFAAYEVENVCNVDKIGLFYNLFLRCTYLISCENKKIFRGTKVMETKDCIAGYVCANAD